MKWSYESVEHARDAVGVLLDQLGLDAYLFSVDPHDATWEIHLEYATDAGWIKRVLEVDTSMLIASFSDHSARSRLVHMWKLALQNAKRAASTRAPG